MPGSASFRKLPELYTTDPEEYEDWVKSAVSFRLLQVAEGGRGFESTINRIELPNLSLTHVVYAAPMQTEVQWNDFMQEFPLTGSGYGRWNGYDWIFEPGQGAVVGGPGAGGVVTSGAGYSHAFQGISPAALTQKLAAMIGRPVEPPLELTGAPCSNPHLVASQVRLIEFLRAEFDRSEGLMPPTVLFELEQAIIVAYLLATEHNYSKWLSGTPRAAAPWQVRRAVDYIEANWDGPISIETLVLVTNTSARSLFFLFNKTYGISPIAYAGRVRLSRARSMLMRPGPDTSVASVGFDCGFSNLRYFAKKYFAAFGELPSATLKKAR